MLLTSGASACVIAVASVVASSCIAIACIVTCTGCATRGSVNLSSGCIRNEEVLGENAPDWVIGIIASIALGRGIVQVARSECSGLEGKLRVTTDCLNLLSQF
jgi:hypothetical protein